MYDTEASTDEHQLLTSLGIDRHKVYPESDNEEQDRISINKYGWPEGFYWSLDYTFAAFLIENLSKFMDSSFTCFYSENFYIPKPRKEYVHFHKEYEHDKEKYLTNEDKERLHYNPDFIFVSLGDAIDRIIKGCRLYLCGSDCMNGKQKYRLKKYRQYCKAVGKDDHKEYNDDEVSEICDEGYLRCLREEYQYGLEILKCIIPYLREW